LRVDGRVDVDDVPLRVLGLEEVLDFLGKGSGVFLGIVLDALDVEHVGLVLLGVLVNLSGTVATELGVVFEEIVDIGENPLVFVFVVIEGQGLSIGTAGNFAALLDVADVEEDAGVSERLLILFGVRNGNLVDFDRDPENRLDNPLNLLLEILVIEVPGLVLLYLFFREAVGLQLDHHL
jgi:hypothetical protein